MYSLIWKKEFCFVFLSNIIQPYGRRDQRADYIICKSVNELLSHTLWRRKKILKIFSNIKMGLLHKNTLSRVNLWTLLDNDSTRIIHKPSVIYWMLFRCLREMCSLNRKILGVESTQLFHRYNWVIDSFAPSNISSLASHPSVNLNHWIDYVRSNCSTLIVIRIDCRI